ncbi:MAG: helix-turn-helix domain-containing protein [Lachnospiraceae bacterium]|nr:helix-turn-helix domain-containing protein [Lachnospiraceae bacterium]
MADFKDMLKYFRSREGLSQSDLAKKLGVSTSTISMYEVGKREPDFETEEKIADFFNTDLNILRGRDTERICSPGAVVIPVLGRVAAGIPLTAAEYIIDTEEIPQAMAADGEYFGLQVKGDSMEPKISNGDVVIVRKQSDADDGDLVIALVNGDDAVVKRLKKYKDGIALISSNPIYEPMFFSKSEIEEKPVEIIGKVKELRAKF